MIKCSVEPISYQAAAEFRAELRRFCGAARNARRARHHAGPAPALQIAGSESGQTTVPSRLSLHAEHRHGARPAGGARRAAGRAAVSTTDGRVVHLTLTEDGHDKLKRVHSELGVERDSYAGLRPARAGSGHRRRPRDESPVESKHGFAHAADGRNVNDIFRFQLQASYDIARLPYTLRVLLENVLRKTGARTTSTRLACWDGDGRALEGDLVEPFRLWVVLTGVPAVVDLAAMRNAMADLGGYQAHQSAHPGRARDRPFGAGRPVRVEPSLREERRARVRGAIANGYAFLCWDSSRSTTSRLVPAPAFATRSTSSTWRGSWTFGMVAFPDTLVGTDSHTTMVNGLGVLGWGAGGI